MSLSWHIAARAGAVAVVWSLAGCVSPEPGPSAGMDWPMYRGDFAGTGYSALDQINVGNVDGLTPAWEYSLGVEGGGPDARSPNSQATPIVVGGVMYLPAADRVVALDPSTGAELWRYAVEGGPPSRRGVAYWPGDEDSGARVIFAAGSRLVALDAGTGTPVPDFGRSGLVDMVIPYNSVPLVFEDIIVVGANTPPGTTGGVGNARAFDVRTGEKLWEFNSVPQPGEVGHDTWEGDSWVNRVGVNAWPFYFTVDVDRELVYLPLAAPIPFPYGGDRPGDNLFGNSLVAVDVRTGQYAWHFQTIHHDLWDHDPPAAPVLFEVPTDGEPIPALGVTTKSGYLYILNRATGVPVFGVEETSVPQSEVPGERTSPTQPIPVAPTGLARVRYEPADLVTSDDTSAEHVAACSELLAGMGEIYHEGPFTPWVYRGPNSPPRTTLLFPGLVGGPNWGGVAHDPTRDLLFAFSQDLGSFGWVEDAADDFPVPYDRGGPRPASFDVPMGAQRWPCQRPPWGRLTAISASTGELVWQRPLGLTEGLPPDRANTGRPGRAAAIVTAGGLLFIASTDDDRFRALDVETGAELWETRLPGRGNANPSTYVGPDGAQYVVVAATETVIAFRLP